MLANEALLLRALSNVLRNAIRYAGDKGPITVTARRDGSTIAISVADRGPGLPESELEEVFAPFYRPESARTQRDRRRGTRPRDCPHLRRSMPGNGFVPQSCGRRT